MPHAEDPLSYENLPPADWSVANIWQYSRILTHGPAAGYDESQLEQAKAKVMAAVTAKGGLGEVDRLLAEIALPTLSSLFTTNNYPLDWLNIEEE